MRRRVVLLLILIMLLLSGCGEDPRTRILLRGINNTSLNPAFVTLSKQLFIPGDSLNLDLSTSWLPASTVSDLVVLDTGDLQADSYYLYIGIDENGNGVFDSGDFLLPVPRISLTEGESVELEGIIVSVEAGFLIDPVGWAQPPGIGIVHIANWLSRAVNNASPLYFTARAGTNISMAIPSPFENEGFLRLSHPAVESVIVLIEPSTDPHVCLFMNLDEADTVPAYIPAAGDYANSAASADNFYSPVWTPPSPDRGELYISLDDSTMILP